MTSCRPLSAFAKLLSFLASVFLLQSAIWIPTYAQDAAPATGPVKAPRLQIRVFRPRSGSPEANRLRAPLAPKVLAQPRANGGPVNTGSGLQYTCDPNVAEFAPAGTCAYLNSVIAGYYNSTFTNANANIYIVFGSTDLGATETYDNYLTYNQYASAYNSISNKSAIQTAALSALGTYDAGPYGSGQVGVTVSLGTALGFPASDFTGITSTGDSCTPGTEGCYNAVTTITNDTVDTPLYYDSLSTGVEPEDAYDFFSTVMHETDEVLGASSCVSTEASPLSDGCDGFGPDSDQVGTPSAVDLFRYSSAGHLVLDSSLSSTAGAYFSYNGGTTNGANGNAGQPKVYNTLDNGDDYADFATTDPDQGCQYNEAIQDAEGCPGQDSGLTILNDGGGEINIINAVGFSTPAANSPAVLQTPTPSTTLKSTSVQFTWSPGTGVTSYSLHLSSVAPGDYDIYASGSTKATSKTVSGIPGNGQTIYVRLYSVINGTTQYNDYMYTALNLSQLTSPAPSSVLSSSTVQFKWSAISGSSGYSLHVSAVAPGDYDIYASGHTTATSTVVSKLPTNGSKIYVRLYTTIGGSTFYNDYTYTALSIAKMTSPATGATFGSTSQGFKWSAANVTAKYDLHLSAVAAGDADLYSSGQVTGTATAVSNLPTNGETIYARLYTIIGGGTYYNDYTYKAK